MMLLEHEHATLGLPRPGWCPGSKRPTHRSVPLASQVNNEKSSALLQCIVNSISQSIIRSVLPTSPRRWPALAATRRIITPQCTSGIPGTSCLQPFPRDCRGRSLLQLTPACYSTIRHKVPDDQLVAFGFGAQRKHSSLLNSEDGERCALFEPSRVFPQSQENHTWNTFITLRRRSLPGSNLSPPLPLV